MYLILFINQLPFAKSFPTSEAWNRSEQARKMKNYSAKANKILYTGIFIENNFTVLPFLCFSQWLFPTDSNAIYRAYAVTFSLDGRQMYMNASMYNVEKKVIYNNFKVQLFSGAKSILLKLLKIQMDYNVLLCFAKGNSRLSIHFVAWAFHMSKRKMILMNKYDWPMHCIMSLD